MHQFYKIYSNQKNHLKFMITCHLKKLLKITDHQLNQANMKSLNIPLKEKVVDGKESMMS